MIGTADLPHVNASLNAAAAVLLLLGRFAIARGRERLHRRLMLGAFAVFALIYLGERPTWRTGVAFLLIIAAVALIRGDGGNGNGKPEDPPAEKREEVTQHQPDA